MYLSNSVLNKVHASYAGIMAKYAHKSTAHNVSRSLWKS